MPASPHPERFSGNRSWLLSGPLFWCPGPVVQTLGSEMLFRQRCGGKTGICNNCPHIPHIENRIGRLSYSMPCPWWRKYQRAVGIICLSWVISIVILGDWGKIILYTNPVHTGLSCWQLDHKQIVSRHSFLSPREPFPFFPVLFASYPGVQ